MSKRISMAIAAAIALNVSCGLDAAQLQATPTTYSVAPNEPHGPTVVIELVGDGSTENFSVDYTLDNNRFQIVRVNTVRPLAGQCTSLPILGGDRAIRVLTSSASGPFPAGATAVCQIAFAVRAGATAGTSNFVPSNFSCFDTGGLPTACAASAATLQLQGSPSVTPVVRYSPGPTTDLDGFPNASTIQVDISAGTSGSTTVHQCTASPGGVVDGAPAVTVPFGDPQGDVDLSISVRCPVPAAAPPGVTATCIERTSTGLVRTRLWNVTCGPGSFTPVPPLIDPASVQATNVTTSTATVRAFVDTRLRAGTGTWELGAADNNTYSSSVTVGVAGTSGGEVLTATFTGLACGTSYRYRLRVNTFGAEARSNPATFQTSACPAGQLGVSFDVIGALHVGSPATFRVAASESGALTYLFDLDGDGTNDMVQSTPEVQATYPSAFVGTATVSVRNSAGVQGSTSRAIGIMGPRLAVSVSGAATERCGDGDLLPEPGERWRVPLVATNNGGIATRGARVTVVASDRLAGAATGPASALRLETPSILVGDLGAGAMLPIPLDVSISPQAACGTVHGLRHFGSSDAVSFSTGPGADIASLVTPPAAQCNVVTTCPSTRASASLTIRQGFYFDPDRAGNGLGSFVVANPGQAPTYFGAWFTGTPGRAPVWYVIQGPVRDDQVVAQVLQFTRDLGASSFRATSAPVGVAVIDFVETERIVFSYTLGARVGSEQMVYLTPGAAPVPNRTGAWFNPAESGWGQVVHQFVDPATSANSTFVVHYVYDTAGNPRWVLGQGGTTMLQTALEHLMFTVHCAGCIWSPANVTGVGSARMTFATATSGSVGTTFSLPLGFGGGLWDRTNLPITILTTPQ